jgi:CxxC-x17-CxxC domain-containing protein
MDSVAESSIVESSAPESGPVADSSPNCDSKEGSFARAVLLERDLHQSLARRKIWPPPGRSESAMESADRVLTCVDCRIEFVFSVEEQSYFHDKGYLNDPRRCRRCRAKRKFLPRRAVRSDTQTICAECGAETTVPFKPTQGKPVLCRLCFKTSKEQAAAQG